MHDSATPSLLTLPPKQPYRINNCKFQNSMISFLSELHSTKAYTDVVLHAEGRVIHAHRVVLAAGSSYFNNLFKSLTPAAPRTECPVNLVVALPNVKYKDLEMVVKFIYLGYLDLVNEELEGFVELAKQLAVVGMSDDEEPAPPPPEPEKTVTVETHEPTPPEQSEQKLETVEEAVFVEPEFVNEEPGSPPQVVGPPLPNEFLQLHYTDEDECLGPYPLEDDEMDEDDEDEENSGEHGNVQPSSAGGSFYAGGAQEKPWKCTKCGKSYNSNKSLWRHKKFTCDEKIEFRCTVCGKSFSRSDNLRRHVVVAHS